MRSMRLVEDGLFLLGRHRHRVLVRVAMQPDLVAGIGHHLHLLGEGLDRVAGDEPGGAQAVVVEHLEQAGAADLPGEEPARDVAGRVLPAVRSRPARHRVHVDADGAEDLLRHALLLIGIERPRRPTLSQLVTVRHNITGRHPGQFERPARSTALVNPL